MKRTRPVFKTKKAEPKEKLDLVTKRTHAKGTLGARRKGIAAYRAARNAKSLLPENVQKRRARAFAGRGPSSNKSNGAPAAATPVKNKARVATNFKFKADIKKPKSALHFMLNDKRGGAEQLGAGVKDAGKMVKRGYKKASNTYSAAKSSAKKGLMSYGMSKLMRALKRRKKK